MDTNNNSNENNNGDSRNSNNNTNKGFTRVNGETRSRNYANNKKNYNNNYNKNSNYNRRNENKDENGEVKKERFTDKNFDRKPQEGGRSNYNRNNNSNGQRSNYNNNYNKNNNRNNFNGERNAENGERNTERNGERQNNGGFTRNNNRNFNKGRDNRVENDRHARIAEENKNYNDVQIDDDEFANLQLEGRNAVLEAIRIKRPIDKILMKKGEVEGTLKVIKAKAIAQGIIVQETAKSNLDEMAKSHNHQGVIALCPAQEYAEVEDMLALAKERNEDPFIIILDGITDTYNLGAIIRTANASGAHGVIIPKRRAAGLTAMVSKASAGAILYTKVARVTNISTEIEKLKEAGLWIVGTDMKAKSLHETNLKGPVAVVIGSEGTGISRLVKEKCDLKVSVPMLGEIESLNASVAGGVLMYEVVRQRLNG